MGVSEIQSNINNLNSEIRSLGNSKTEYQNMNNQINKAITELSTSYNHIETAQTQLAQNYSSKMADKKLEELGEIADSINELIRILRDEILAESNRKISSINSQIQGKQQEVTQQNQKLQEEKNKE